jgi:TRAP-type mannitol/chloroaromatic compound transport system substrate-binding protein
MAGFNVALVSGSTSNAQEILKTPSRKPEYRLRLSSWYEPDFLNQFSMTQRLAERIYQISNGRLEIEVLKPGTEFPRTEIFKRVADGTVDMGRTLSYYWNKELNRSLDFFLTIPFGMTEQEFSVWLYQLDGQKLWDEVYASYGVKPFLCGSLDVQSFGWFKQEIRTINDFQGLRYRTTGPMFDIMARLGAKPIELSGNEILPALREGRLDGAELVGPAADINFEFETVAPYCYYPGFHQPMGAIELLVNKARFESLPSDLQAIISAVCQAERDTTQAQMHLLNARALRKLQQEGTMQLRRLPEDVLAIFKKASEEWMVGVTNKGDALTQNITKSYLAATALLQPWTEVSQGWFIASRELNS